MNIIDKVLKVLPQEEKDKLLQELPQENKDKILKDLLAKDKDSMSFQAAMALCRLPVVTFFQGDKSFNFLLDTGSTNCIIDSNIIAQIEHKTINKTSNMFGLEGKPKEVGMCAITLYYNQNPFPFEYVMQDMSGAFGIIKQETGVSLHGIIGTPFFDKYKYVLDFAELIAYSKQ